ncbi:hypothetical protein ACWDE0_17120 [Streptomyces sp. 900105755]
MGPHAWQPAELGLDADEAYEIEIRPRVVHGYSAHHGVSPKTAIVQIRSLLEDLITTEAPTETNEDGNWRILFPREGYGLMLSPDRTLILRYCTRHAERTWAQVRSGVTSRISDGRNKGRAWCREALAKHLPIHVTTSALHGYTKHALGVKVTRDNVDELACQLACHLNDHVLPKWQRSPSETIDDKNGITWVLVVDDQSPDGAVVANYATPAEATT